MTTSVIICDDSAMARKQMSRSLPSDWDISLHYADQGRACLDLIRQGYGGLIFLDLNMPEMDGYEVLQCIKAEELPALVIVVSGDVQPQARARVIRLGAIDFIRKPLDSDTLPELLREYGLYQPSESVHRAESSPADASKAQEDSAVTWTDALREIANVAMGQAGDRLARFLDVFVTLPIPRVNTLEASELSMALSVTGSTESWSGVCQGFVGAGAAGEALLVFNDSRIDDMAKLLGYETEPEANRDIEVLMDMSSILVGAFIQGLGQQLDVHFGLSHPSVLGTHVMIEDLLQQNQPKWQQMLAIELNYAIEGHDIQCDLLLLFTEDSIPWLQRHIQYMIE